MHTDPHTILLIGKQVDVVVARADGAELRIRLLKHRLCGLREPARMLVADERRIIVALTVLATDAEAQRAPDVVHDAMDIGA